MFIDPNSRRRHYRCGRSHAVEHRLILDQRRQEDEEEEAAIQFSMNQSIHPSLINVQFVVLRDLLYLVVGG